MEYQSFATNCRQSFLSAVFLGKALDELHASRLGKGNQSHGWVSSEISPAEGWVYFAPTDHSDEAWDLSWIGFGFGSQRQGIGEALLRLVEDQIIAAGRDCFYQNQFFSFVRSCSPILLETRT